MLLQFAPGTPPEVRDVIEEVLALPSLDRRSQAGIERLAGDSAMTGLWQGDMPAELLDAAPDIMRYAIVAYAQALGLPKTKVHAEFGKLVSDPQMAGIGVTARHLHEKVRNAAGRLHPVWSSSKLEGLLTALTDLAALSDRVTAEAAAIDNLLAMPELPRKLGSATAREVYFIRAMKNLFERCFYQPHAKVVATLAQVAFDLRNGVDESRVLKV
jgi:hypothetical protein